MYRTNAYTERSRKGGRARYVAEEAATVQVEDRARYIADRKASSAANGGNCRP